MNKLKKKGDLSDRKAAKLVADYFFEETGVRPLTAETIRTTDKIQKDNLNDEANKICDRLVKSGGRPEDICGKAILMSMLMVVR